MQAHKPQFYTGKVYKRANILGLFVLILLGLQINLPAYAKSRRLEPGENMPAFTAQLESGKIFSYDPAGKKVVVVAFLAEGQKRSAHAAQDILKILAHLKINKDKLDVTIVGDKPAVRDYLKKPAEEAAISPIFTVDKDWKLWGTFGIIVSPTVIVGGTDGKVVCVKAGHSYDFMPVLQSNLQKALGIKQEVSVEDASKVKTLKNDNPRARSDRYVRLAGSMMEKEQYEVALIMLQKALKGDPGSIKAKIMAGKLNCLLGEGQAALNAIEGVEGANNMEKADILLVRGWANRRLKNYEIAEKSLLEAAKLNLRSPRILFELGNVYQETSKPDLASKYYRQALLQLLGNER